MSNKLGNIPIVLTEEQKQEIENLACFCTVEQIADYLGINRATFFRILKRDDEVLRLYKKGKVKGLKFAASHLMKKVADGDTVATIFYLKTKGKWSSENHDASLVFEGIGVDTPEKRKDYANQLFHNFTIGEIGKGEYDSCMDALYRYNNIVAVPEIEKKIEDSGY